MSDRSETIIEEIKHQLYDMDTNEPQAAADGTTHNLAFVTWCGDGCSFILADDDGEEYRVRVTKEIK